MKAQVKVYLNPMSKPMVQLSVTNFHFVKPGLLNMFRWCEWDVSHEMSSYRDQKQLPAGSSD